MAEPDPHWLERVKAVGAAQARYLWVLLILMLFYAALQLQTASSPGRAKVPIIDLEISSILVLASGTGVLSLVVLAIAGSMRALKRAREQGLGEDTGEEFDVHPNVIDLAFYAPPRSTRFLVHLARLVYAIFLSLGLAEGLWLWPYMGDARLPVWYVVVVAVIGTLLWIRAAWLVMWVWYGCIRNYLTLRTMN